MHSPWSFRFRSYSMFYRSFCCAASAFLKNREDQSSVVSLAAGQVLSSQNNLGAWVAAPGLREQEMLLPSELCFALDTGSLKLYLLILEMVQKKNSLIKNIPFFLTLIHKMLLIMSRINQCPTLFIINNQEDYFCNSRLIIMLLNTNFQSSLVRSSKQSWRSFPKSWLWRNTSVKILLF